jgi:hypothetical protein
MHHTTSTSYLAVVEHYTAGLPDKAELSKLRWWNRSMLLDFAQQLKKIGPDRWNKIEDV